MKRTANVEVLDELKNLDVVFLAIIFETGI